MKNNLYRILLATALMLSIQSCDKNDDNNISLQDHDQNEMMAQMHVMMEKMMAMPMTNDPDVDFAMMMRIHHQGAIDMAKLELAKGKDAQLKSMAQKIIDDQQQEIQELSTFLQGHPAHLNVPEFSSIQMMNMEKSSRNADLQIITGNTDHDFATLMIIHHQNALEDASLELIYGHDQEMKTMASRMIDAQGMEIKTLQEWLLGNRNH